ncbi:MAG: ABC transporter ATP-binding protein [Anaerolineae bacterium]
MKDPIIVDQISKQFRRFSQDRPHTFQEAIAKGFGQIRAVDKFWALKDVSFSIPSGKMLGVIGHNGAGKSTLLRLIGKLGRPDKGNITTNGRIGTLLSLGAGFHPELTGRENVFINGVISGLLRSEVIKKFDSIVDFAELDQFIDNPLHTYSNGMKMRLGFAVATHIQPEILLIDEVLAVGDIAFQEKCIKRILTFKEQGCTILIVSHSNNFVAEHCDDALWLNKGKIKGYGPAADIVQQYAQFMQTKNQA